MGLGMVKGHFAEVTVGRFARAGCPRCVATGMHLARLRNVVSPSTRPPRRWFTQGVGTKTFSPFLDFFGLVGPSRPRRAPRPAPLQTAGPDANRGSGRA